MRILELENEVAELKAKLNRNSQNSHKPPSQDGFKKPKNLRPKSERPSGGQPGHMGRTLLESDRPDRQIKHVIKRCPYCCFNLEDVNDLA